ncbi:hypothetical protein ACIF83_41080 [Streptomyces sp. NPDC085866]|uniref:hypothetical protein n=1 Tax=Streptomyces sp. NPDC085866 TaxID=3365736 RepID=UPI0037D78BC7
MWSTWTKPRGRAWSPAWWRWCRRRGPGRSRDGFTTKRQLSPDGRCRQLSLIVTPRQRAQRHSVKRIFDCLVAEHGVAEVTYPMLRAYVADRRPQIRIEAGR